ncbi:MAG: polysaccharide deacetylase family protein [Nanoarchaeota archaeon]|nr:polysaccharide deacetylase family protein [Nanoarchaeota archaeon]
MKKVLLTFDVEEFDLPREFGQKISDKEMYETSKNGLDKITFLLNKYNLKSTFFTTANFAKKHPKSIINLENQGHEIACHGYCHSDCYTKGTSKIPLAKKEIEKIIGKKIKGFRAPRFEINDISKLSEFEFEYDSSSHPTIAPGKYFNFNQKRKIHKMGNITEIPLSTLPLFPFLRAPFNWYMFRHFPMIYGKLFASINFSFSNYLMMIFHPWEFVDLNKYNIPMAFKKKSGENLFKKLEKYILFCKKKNWEFDTVEGFLSKRII